MVFLSKDSGTTWTNTGVAGSYVASSADGTNLAVVGWPGQILFSKDSGATWTVTGASYGYWGAIVSSADGNIWLGFELANSGILFRSRSMPAPALGLVRKASALVLSWIVPSANFVLQQNSDLSPTNWVDVTSTPVLNRTNLQNELMLFPSDHSGFYRLVTP
jgi:hypothetical protein